MAMGGCQSNRSCNALQGSVRPLLCVAGLVRADVWKHTCRAARVLDTWLPGCQGGQSLQGPAKLGAAAVTLDYS
jgi:hypothetical protein